MDNHKSPNFHNLFIIISIYFFLSASCSFLFVVRSLFFVRLFLWWFPTLPNFTINKAKVVKTRIHALSIKWYSVWISKFKGWYYFRLRKQTTLWGLEVLFLKKRMEEGVLLKWNDKSDKSETEYVIMDKWTRSEVFKKKNVNVPQQQICPNGIIRKDSESTWSEVTMRKKKKENEPDERGPTSLFLFTPTSPVRKMMMWLVNWPPFDWVIIITIIANCVVMSMDDKLSNDDKSIMSLKLVSYTSKRQINHAMLLLINWVFTLLYLNFRRNSKSYLWWFSQLRCVRKFSHLVSCCTKEVTWGIPGTSWTSLLSPQGKIC